MASVAERYPQNAAGRFYVNSECIDCDNCRDMAPGFFVRDDDGAHSFVCDQPETEEEIELCIQAMEDCPVEAIGDAA